MHVVFSQSPFAQIPYEDIKSIKIQKPYGSCGCCSEKYDEDVGNIVICPKDGPGGTTIPCVVKAQAFVNFVESMMRNEVA